MFDKFERFLEATVPVSLAVSIAAIAVSVVFACVYWVFWLITHLPQ